MSSTSPSPSPVPLLRPPLPNNRSTGGARTPRLGLSIPPSPSQRAVNNSSAVPDLPALQPRPSATRSAAPQLRLATPLGSSTTPLEAISNSRPPLGSANDENTPHEPGRVSGPSSASSASLSAVSFGNGLRQGIGTPDPASAISSVYSHEGAERDGTLHTLPDLSKLSLDKGRELDVDDLDDEGWMAASEQGKIEELATLGEGAGGAVTKCRLKGGKTIFALKIITTDPDPDVQKQIRRELEFNRKIAADHICKYYGAFGDPRSGIISIIMECCEGGSLDSIYKTVKKLGGRIGEKVLGKIAEGVLEGLTYLYKCKIIHRDIKPSNILLSADGRVKLCDFGVSGEFGTREDADTFIGTSYYMAPERITGQSYTINSDVWSLGVTLLEVAQHRFPFPADGTEDTPQPGLIEIIQYIVGRPLPKLKDEPAKGNEPAIVWSENMKYFIECCLEKDPARRATPWRMLEHPWIVDMRGRRVNMTKFLRQVWEWPEDYPPNHTT